MNQTPNTIAIVITILVCVLWLHTEIKKDLITVWSADKGSLELMKQCPDGWEVRIAHGTTTGSFKCLVDKDGTAWKIYNVNFKDIPYEKNK